jgi:hypothetical protein
LAVRFIYRSLWRLLRGGWSASIRASAFAEDPNRVGTKSGKPSRRASRSALADAQYVGAVQNIHLADLNRPAPGADRAALHRRWQRGVNLDRDAASSLFHHVRCTPDSVSKIRVVASVMTGRGEARLPPLDGRYLAPGAEQTALCIR